MPAVFATFTAPSFGQVHGVRTGTSGERPNPAAPAGNPTLPTRRRMACSPYHAKADRIIGTPLCLDCYDYDAQVVWNQLAGELWRRTTVASASATWTGSPAARA